MLLSLCLPTNGVIEWVFPVLDSIYSQNVGLDKFEVIVTNNGTNDEFNEMMLEYAKRHENLIYKKTDAVLFDNQLEALKLASGVYFKFINHRSYFLDGSLEYLISVIQNHLNDKPIIYFANGVVKETVVVHSFDEFVRGLGRYISWTTGVGIWKEDYDKLPENLVYDKISPHSCILFSERKRHTYIIDNYVFSQDIESDHSKKGKYDLFKAFALEEVSIAQKLLIDGDISYETFKSVKDDYKRFVSELYWMFCVLKRPCSYDLTGFNDAMGIYFTKTQIIFGAYKAWFIRGIKGIAKKMWIKTRG